MKKEELIINLLLWLKNRIFNLDYSIFFWGGISVDDKILSIIIPAYNCKKTIAKCLKSINLNINYEIIVVDDGSIDGTSEIIIDLLKKLPEIRYFKIENHGVSYARNYGINESKGDYIFFLDSDDILINTYVFNRVLFNKEFDLICFNFNKNIQNCFNRPRRIKNDNVSRETFLEKYYYDEKYYYLKNYIWGKIFRSDIIKKNNIRFDEKISFGEDTLFLSDYLVFANDIIFREDIIYVYSVNTNDSLSKKKLNQVDFLSYANYIIKNVYVDSIKCSEFYLNNLLLDYSLHDQFDINNFVKVHFSKYSKIHKGIITSIKKGKYNLANKKIKNINKRRVLGVRIKESLKRILS